MASPFSMGRYMKKLIHLIELRKIQEARSHLSKIIGNLSRRDFLFFTALLEQLEGDKNAAKQGYLNLLTEFPVDLPSVVNLAAIYNEAGDYRHSLEVLHKISFGNHTTQHKTALFDAYFGLRDNKAADIIRSLLDESPQAIEFQERYAALLLQQNKLEKSIEILSELASKHGDSRPQLYGNLAAAYNRLGMYELGISCADKAIEKKPLSWQFQLNKANSLMSLERTTEAEEILKKLLTDGHRAPEILGNMARIENLRGNHSQSLIYCDEGLKKSPQDSSILCCMADNYSALGDSDKAYEYYKKSLMIKPDDDLANWHLALSLLRDGRFTEGWQQYKWGFKRKRSGRGAYKFNPEDEWKGEMDVKNLLVWGEQGIGDELMFSKFLKYIPDSIEHIELRVDNRLVSVFKKRLITRSSIEIKPYADQALEKHIPIGNLPSVLWSAYEADPVRLAPFMRRTTRPASKVIRVGIAWRGGKSERMQSKRSVPLGLFRRLSSLLRGDVQLVMLQYNPLPEEMSFLQTVFKDRVSLPNYDAYKDLDAWVDHIDSCDLLLSVDNSAIHFSGSMGIPTLAMIPQHSDFRWGRNESTNPWYESVELLRNSDNTNLDELAFKVDYWLKKNIKGLTNE